MSLQETIKKDMFQAMKARDAKRKATLTYLSSELKRVAIDKRVDILSDDESMAILQKQLKQQKESLDAALTANRADLEATCRFEMEVISEYLPKAPTEAESQALADAIIAELGATEMKDMGRVMSEVTKKCPMVDKGKLSGYVKSRLS